MGFSLNNQRIFFGSILADHSIGVTQNPNWTTTVIISPISGKNAFKELKNQDKPVNKKHKQNI